MQQGSLLGPLLLNPSLLELSPWYPHLAESSLSIHLRPLLSFSILLNSTLLGRSGTRQSLVGRMQGAPLAGEVDFGFLVGV